MTRYRTILIMQDRITSKIFRDTKQLEAYEEQMRYYYPGVESHAFGDIDGSDYTIAYYITASSTRSLE